MNRGVNKRYDFHFNAVSPANHPPLLNPGEGMAQATKYDRMHKELKLKVEAAKYELKKHEIEKPAAKPMTKKVGK